MTADERLALINTKVERAKKHIADLYLERRAFLDTNPYAVDTKRNPQTRQLIYYMANVLRPGFETPGWAYSGGQL